MPDDKNKIAELKDQNDALEHEVIEIKLKGLKGQILSLGDTLHQRITDSEKTSEVEFSHIKEGIERIEKITVDTLNQTRETNGRVSIIEADRKVEALQKKLDDKERDEIKKNTRVVRFLHKYPIVTTGFLLVSYLFSMPEVRRYSLEGIQRFFSLFSRIF